MSVNKLFRQNHRESNHMKISDVNITFVKQQGGLIGFASLVLMDDFYVSGIAIHERLNGVGYRLTYPNRKSGDQVFNICHPINRQASKAVESAVFQKIKDVKKKSCNNAGYDCHKFTA